MTDAEKDRISIRLEPVERVSHPLLLEAMAIYEDAFPPEEKMSAHFWLKLLLTQPPEMNLRLIASEQMPGQALGLMLYDAAPNPQTEERKAAFLWYLCVRKDLRGSGIGAEAFGQLLKEVYHRGCVAVVFEVEDPDAFPDSEEQKAKLARRRIGWYRRQGAKLLEGVHWTATTDTGTPGVPMRLMLHAPAPLSPEEAFRFACQGLEAEITVTGTLGLT